MKVWVDTHVPEFFRRKWVLVVGLLIVWFVIGRIFRGVHTLDLPNAQDTPTTAFLGDMAANIRAARAENPIFVYVFNPFRQGIESFIEVIRLTISEPASGGVIPLIGWFGVVALIGFIVFATSNWRSTRHGQQANMPMQRMQRRCQNARYGQAPAQTPPPQKPHPRKPRPMNSHRATAALRS